MIDINKCSNCLDNCLQIKNLCECTDCSDQYYLSDFVPEIRQKYFSDLATEEHGSGAKLAKSLIKGAQMDIYSDILRAKPEDFGIVMGSEIVCSKCTFTSVYNTGGGVDVSAVRTSSMNRLTITTLSYQTNFTGAANLIVCDTLTQEVLFTSPVNLVANTPQVATLNQSFDTSRITIKFDNETIGLSVMNCPKKGCGCGGKKLPNVNFSGNGFKPCIELICNADMLLCNVLSQFKPLVAKAIAYKVAIHVYDMMRKSTVYKDTQLNIDMQAVEQNQNTLEGKYHELIFGSAQAYGRGATNGMVQMLSATAKSLSKTDKCISCQTTRYRASAIR